MNQSSQEHAENTRNIEAALLRALAETGQSRVARTKGRITATGIAPRPYEVRSEL